MTHSVIKTALRSWPAQGRPTRTAASVDVVVLGSLHGLNEARRAALWSALSLPCPVWPAGHGKVGTASSWLASLVGWPLRRLQRPALIVTNGFGLLTAMLCVYRWLSRSPKLVVFVMEPPGRLGLLETIILRLADGVLVDGDAAALALSGPASVARSVIHIAPDYQVARFLRIDPTRSVDQARRLIVVSDLTPGSGAADLLVAVMGWSEAHPDEAVELNWIGEGDLAGLLAAQPLPANVSQVFLGQLDPDEVTATFARCGLLVMPSIVEDLHAPVAQALAAGLPVLGSRRSRDIRHLVTDGVNGWLFDPLTPGDMLQGVTRALGTDGRQLDEMRLRARDTVSAAPSGHPLARISRRDTLPSSGLHTAAQRAP